MLNRSVAGKVKKDKTLTNLEGEKKGVGLVDRGDRIISVRGLTEEVIIATRQ